MVINEKNGRRRNASELNSCIWDSDLAGRHPVNTSVPSAFCSIFAAAVVPMSAADKHCSPACKSHVSQPAALWHEYIFPLSASAPTMAYCEYFMSTCEPMMTNTHVTCVWKKKRAFCVALFFVCFCSSCRVVWHSLEDSCKTCMFLVGSLNCSPETVYWYLQPGL